MRLLPRTPTGRAIKVMLINADARIKRLSERARHEDHLRSEYERTSHPAPTKAIGYVRNASGPYFIAHVSLEKQRERIRQYARSCGMELVDMAYGHGESGTASDLSKRPGFRLLLERITDLDEPVDVIITDCSQLGRKLQVYLDLEKELEARGSEIRVLNEEYLEAEATKRSQP